jgi:rhodanese-related sulfurtransferase
MKKHLLASLLAFVLAFAFGAGQAVAKDMTAADYKTQAQQVITEVSVSDAKALLDKGEYIFLDCRTAMEFNNGHIPGAVNVPRGLIEFHFGPKVTTDKEAKIAVYCKSGGRGSLATQTLNEMGYKNAVNIDGGFDAWVCAGQPVQK